MEKKYKALIETSAKVLEETKPLQEYEEPHMDPDEFVGVGNKGQDYHKYQRNPEDLRWKRAEIEVPEPKKKVKRTVKRIVKDHVEVDEAMSGSSLEGGERGALGRGGGKITVGGVKNYAPYKYAKTGSEKESAIQRFKKQFPDRETGIDEKYEGKERRKINRFSKPERRKKEPMFTKSTKPQTPEEKQASLDYYTRAGKPFGRRVASRSFNLGDKNPPIKTEYRTDSVEYDGESLDERESMYRRGGGLDISKKLGRFGKMTRKEMEGTPNASKVTTSKPKHKPHGIKSDPAYKKAKTKKQILKAREQWNLRNPMDLWVGDGDAHESVEVNEHRGPHPKWSLKDLAKQQNPLHPESPPKLTAQEADKMFGMSKKQEKEYLTAKKKDKTGIRDPRYQNKKTDESVESGLKDTTLQSYMGKAHDQGIKGQQQSGKTIKRIQGFIKAKQKLKNKGAKTPAVIGGVIQGDRLDPKKLGTGNVYKPDTIKGESVEVHEDHDARELHLHADNDANLHRQRLEPIRKNLRNKMARGTYDSDKAHKAWTYASKDAADSYHKTHGHKFSSDTVHKVAATMRDNFESEAKDGDHDHHLYKKYKGHKVGADTKESVEFSVEETERERAKRILTIMTKKSEKYPKQSARAKKMLQRMDNQGTEDLESRIQRRLGEELRRRPIPSWDEIVSKTPKYKRLSDEKKQKQWDKAGLNMHNISSDDPNYVHRNNEKFNPRTGKLKSKKNK